MVKDEIYGELLAGALTWQDLAAIERAPLKERTHPLGRLLRYRESSGCEYGNTKYALRIILDRTPEWLKRQAHRLRNVKDYTEPASALAEIRAYAYLLDVGFRVSPIPKRDVSAIDFEVYDPGGLVVEVEVFAKHITKREADSLSAFHRAKPVQSPPGSVVICEHVVTPMGKPRPGESVTENAISKLTQIKSDEKQFSGEAPAILWVDGQDESLSLFSWRSAALPLVNDRSGFHSGELWHACYGKVGLPVFEHHWAEALGLEGDFDSGYVLMRHDGRFIQETKLSCIIVAGKRGTYAMENPQASHRLPRAFWKSFSQVRNFDFASSWLDWPEGGLRERLDIEYRRIDALQNLAPRC